MSKYVLEILDGSQKGLVFPIEGERVTLGRRPENSLVLKDEKCSGQHAEIVQESGQFVLRDLDSRNGTILDGRKIQEVALSPFDILQIGTTQIAFRDADQAMPTDDMSMTTLDQSTVARRGGQRKLPIGAILVVVLLIAGGGAWAYLEFLGGDSGGGGTSRGPKKPLVVRGNQIPVGVDNFEGDGGWVLSGLELAGFEIAVGRALAHTGDTAIEAVYREDEEDGTKYRLALAQLAEPVTVSPDSKLELTGHLETGGSARAALRIRFQSTVDGATLTAGTNPVSYDGYEPVTLSVAVPRGVDRAEVQILALLPDETAAVRADDIALVVNREADVEPIALSTDNGRTMSGAGGGFRVTTGEHVVLHGVRPLVDDPLLLELGRLGELAPSDAGLSVEAAASEDSGFDVKFAVASGGQAKGVVLEFPVASASVLARESEDAPFVPFEPTFSARVADVLLGSDETRCMLTFSGGANVTGAHGRGAYEISLDGAYEFGFHVRFEGSAKTARELNRAAARSKRERGFAAALDAIQQVVEKHPHDDRLAREAQAMRVEILGELGTRAAELIREGAAARFFDARNGYERVSNGIDALIAQFGEKHVPQIEALRALAQRMRDGIGVLDKAAGTEHKAVLEELADALADSGQDALGKTVRTYITTHYPATDDGTGNGDEGGK